jgi:hypothetical protein
MSSLDRHRKFAPFFDVDPVTGRSIEVFYADRTLETFGRGGSGWFWWPRRRGFAPDCRAVGPFPTSYSAYRDALHSAQRKRSTHPFFGIGLQLGCNDHTVENERTRLGDFC